MAFEIDLRKLENDYSTMTAEEFALLRRSDLTPAAAEIYDRVAAIRSDTPADSAIRILLENDYSIMPAEEFALLRRRDLTPEAAEIYDRVAAIRRAADDSVLEIPPVSSDTPGPDTALMREATGSETFEDIVEWAYSTLPQSIKDLPDFPGIQVADEPPEGYLETRGRRTELLGLFHGAHRGERQFHSVQRAPDLIFVFRGPIMRCSNGNLRREVKRAVWHEVAHWLGYEEKDMEKLGL